MVFVFVIMLLVYLCKLGLGHKAQDTLG